MAYLNAKREHRRLQWATEPVLCGDLNNPSHRLDATASLSSISPCKVTTRSIRLRASARFRPRGRGGPRFYLPPPSCHVLHCQVVRCNLSDHRPVMVEFTLK